MNWPAYQSPPLSPAKAAIDPDRLTRLKMAGDIAHATLEELPKEIARLYAKQMVQLQNTIERVSK